ncbi:predicted protein [Naegleria gruberi]|uniref:Predicted protein n=1 Tax=Naegleria gruberi TaxID=5762 RepID=D2VZ55_NAEGR|nr:uncharacterized protein NAEGRDRAFT_74365 [Naegleria gruberi]EFC37933.1 predicted protein [Naegleria gruberi]|eukprot:XP_002670677.1 predicted protein [Naegleria gruberi strain NEG-M]
MNENLDFKLREEQVYINYYVHGGSMYNSKCLILWSDSLLAMYSISSEECARYNERIYDDSIKLMEISPDDSLLMVSSGLNEKKTFKNEDNEELNILTDNNNDYSKQTLNEEKIEEVESNEIVEEEIARYSHNVDYFSGYPDALFSTHINTNTILLKSDESKH